MDIINDSPKPYFTVGIGGAAGDGIREAGLNLSRLLSNLGYEVYNSLNYPSIIRGGHNFARVTFGRQKVWNNNHKLDLLVALNDETVVLHENELTDSSVVLAEKFTEQQKVLLGKNALELPMSETAAKLNAPPITRNSMALGAICSLLGLSYDLMMKDLHQVFKEKKLEANITLADYGFNFFQKSNCRHHKVVKPAKKTKQLIDGNTAFAKGLLMAGLDFYLAYPMTPSTPILHFLASAQTETNIRVIQPENELAVINMALGLSYGGKRVAIGTATGGFALMTEAYSFASIAEQPLVIAVSQRQGPATGVPTHTSQADLRFILGAGHGDFPRVVIAPGSPEEAFEAGARALNLAWKYQMPIIVLLDKSVSEDATTCDPFPSIKAQWGKIDEGKESGYKRYRLTNDGVSPLLFPGSKGAEVKVSSYEHDEEGIATEDPLMIRKMIDKRFSKEPFISKELKDFTYKLYGDKDSQIVIVFWGSTKGPVLEAIKYLSKPVKCLQILTLVPMEAELVAQQLVGAKKIINVEVNHTGQMAGLIREKTGVAMSDSVLKYDSNTFETFELVEKIEEIIKDE